MGTFKIDCYCNERQMNNVLNMLAKHLKDSDKREVADFDDVMDDIRICAEFDTYMDTVCLKKSEILDSDWNLLYEDTAVFTSRLKAILKEHNRSNKEAVFQAHHVLKDQRSMILNSK